MLKKLLLTYCLVSLMLFQPSLASSIEDNERNSGNQSYRTNQKGYFNIFPDEVMLNILKPAAVTACIGDDAVPFSERNPLNLMLVCKHWNNLIKDKFIDDGIKYSKSKVDITKEDYEKITHDQISMLRNNRNLAHITISNDFNIFNNQYYHSYSLIFWEGLLDKPNLKSLTIWEKGSFGVIDLRYMWLNLGEENSCNYDPQTKRFGKNSLDYASNYRYICNCLEYNVNIEEEIFEKYPHLKFLKNPNFLLNMEDLTGSTVLCTGFEYMVLKNKKILPSLIWKQEQ